MNDASRAESVSLGSDVGPIVATSSAHFASHFLMLAPAPLLPLMSDDLGAGYLQLGLLVTVMYATSGLGQILAGVLVDRWGSHRLLLCGLALQASSMGLMGLVPGFTLLLPLAAAAGLGNSVYHPADLSILSHRVSRARVGRAFAWHTTGGVIGFAASPLLVGLVGSAFGWRVAFLAAGCFALAIWLALFLFRDVLTTDAHAAKDLNRGARRPGHLVASFRRFIATPVIFYGFLFFALFAVAEQGIQGFGIATLVEGYGVTLVWGTIAITGYQACRVAGIQVGGVIADRTSRHEIVTATGLLIGSGFVLVLALAAKGAPISVLLVLLGIVGLMSGVALPARDILIQKSASAGSYGTVFGAVYSGLDAGSMIAPLVYGALLDRNLPQAVFVVGAVSLAAAAWTVQRVRSGP